MKEKIPILCQHLKPIDKAARKLHHAVNRLNCVQILGREHLDAKDWGHGNWNLEILLEASD